MGLTDKHLAYGDDIPQTKEEKDYYWALKDLKEKQQKIGEWIDDADKIDAKFGRHAYKCPKCGKYANYFVGGTEVWWDIIKPNFCPNCGARMVEQLEKSEYEHDHEVVKAYNDGQAYILDKIRAEIEQLPTNTRTNWDGCCPDINYPEIEYVDVSKKQLLEIIDKYRAESEEE